MDPRILNIDERIRNLQDRVLPPGGNASSANSFYQAWHNASHFAVEERLTRLGISIEDAQEVFCDREPYSGEEVNPHLRLLRSIYERFAIPPSERGAELTELARPLIAYGECQLNERLEKIQLPGQLCDLRLTGSGRLKGILSERLNQILFRIWLLELNISRLTRRDDSETPEARKMRFVQEHLEPGAATMVLSAYPVLVRHLATALNQWIDMGERLFARLSADWSALVERFGFAEVKSLDGVRAAGDFHEGGQAVMVLYFDNKKRLVYKPRSMAVDLGIAKLIEVINSCTDFNYRAPRTLARESYGWAEYISKTRQVDEAILPRFYYQMGGYVALAHITNAADLHFENIIATNTGPIIIDPEAFLQPVCRRRDASPRCSEIAIDLVTRARILPEKWNDPAIAKSSGPGVHDIGALGAAIGRKHPTKALGVENLETDYARLTPAELLIRSAPSQPGGTSAGSATRYLAEIIQGFRALYRVFMDGPLSSRQEVVASLFSEVSVRFVPRPTEVYDRLRNAAMHPDYAQHALHTEVLFEALWEIPRDQSEFLRLVPAERCALWRLDIPKFTAAAKSTTLEENGRKYERFFAKSGLDALRDRLASLSSSDMKLQEWVIRATLEPKSFCSLPRSGSSLPNENGTQDFVAAALSLARCVAEYAILDRRNARVTWIDYNIHKHNIGFRHAPANMYDGIVGIGVFLSYMAAVSKVTEFDELISTIAVNLQDVVADGRQYQWRGGYWGLPGVLYGLELMRRATPHLVDTSAIIDIEQEVVRSLPSDRDFDVIQGSAGTMLCLLSLHAWQGDAAYLRAAVACAEHLVAAGQRVNGRLAWTMHGAEKSFTGLAHGSAGISYALAAVAHATNREEFLASALDGIAYERSVRFSEMGANRGLQPDWHDSNGQAAGRPGYANWCHGAAGIGLAQLGQARLYGIPGLDDDIAYAAEVTAANLLSKDMGLCHGTFGRLAFLHRYLQWRPQSPQAGYILDLSVKLAARAHGKMGAINAGTHFGGKVGLMTGMSGVGYELLQWGTGYRLPEVLLLGHRAFGDVDEGVRNAIR